MRVSPSNNSPSTVRASLSRPLIHGFSVDTSAAKPTVRVPPGLLGGRVGVGTTAVGVGFTSTGEGILKLRSHPANKVPASEANERDANMDAKNLRVSRREIRCICTII